MKIANKTVWQVALILVLSLLLSSCMFLLPRSDPEEEETQATTKDSTEPEDDFGQAEATIEDFLKALTASDFESLSEQTDDVFSKDIFAEEEWPISEALFAAVFEDMTWMIGEKEMVSDSVAQVNVGLTYGNFEAAGDALRQDTDSLVEIVKPIVLFYAEKMEQEEAFLEYSGMLETYLLAEIENNDDRMYGESDFQLEYDKKEDAWIVTRIPEVFFSFSDFHSYDPLNQTTEEDLAEILLSASQELLDDGEINQEEYDYLESLFIEILEGSTTEASAVFAALEKQGWYDADTDQYVTEFPVGAEWIYYQMEFNKTMPEQLFKYDVYVGDEEEPVISAIVEMLDDDFLIFPLQDEGGWKENEVHIIIYLFDRSVIADEYVEVK
jgi:hypothetical protein